jgi:hypothetical protein
MAHNHVRFQVLTASSMKTTVFLDVAPYSLVYIDRRFRSAYCFHHQGDETSLNFCQTARRNIPEESSTHNSVLNSPTLDAILNRFNP